LPDYKQNVGIITDVVMRKHNFPKPLVLFLVCRISMFRMRSQLEL